MGNNCETTYDTVCKDRFNDQNKRFDTHDLKLDEILHVLKGNGGAGLSETVRAHNTRIIAIEEGHKDVKQAMRGVIKWIVGIVGGSWLLAKSPDIIAWLRNAL